MSGGMNRPGVSTVWTARKIRKSIRWWCAPLGWSTAVTCWRRSAVVTSYGRHWSRLFCVGARRYGKPSLPFKEESGRYINLQTRNLAATRARVDVWRAALGVASISGYRRRGLADGEKRVALRWTRTELESTERSVPHVHKLSAQWKGPDTGYTYLPEPRAPFKWETAYLATTKQLLP